MPKIEKRVAEEGLVANEPKGAASQTGSGEEGRLRRWWRPVLAVLGIVFAAFFFLVSRQVLAIVQKPSWPPAADAITAVGAQQAVEAFAARRDPRPSDVGMPYAWSTASALEPWPEGKTFFPKIFDDVRAIAVAGWIQPQAGDSRRYILTSEGQHVLSAADKGDDDEALVPPCRRRSCSIQIITRALCPTADPACQ
jgi:hypothetical protein